MPTYWLYRLDSRGAMIEPGSNYKCDNRKQALTLAEMFIVDGVQVEIRREAEDGGSHVTLSASAARCPPPRRRTAAPPAT